MHPLIHRSPARCACLVALCLAAGAFTGCAQSGRSTMGGPTDRNTMGGTTDPAAAEERQRAKGSLHQAPPGQNMPGGGEASGGGTGGSGGGTGGGTDPAGTGR